MNLISNIIASFPLLCKYFAQIDFILLKYLFVLKNDAFRGIMIPYFEKGGQ